MTLQVSDAAFQMILGFEVTDEQVYNQEDLHPTWPDGESGVTIGIGYDLGYADVAQIEADWRYLDPAVVKRLTAVAGKTGSAAAAEIAGLSDIVVPFDVAETVFRDTDMPRYSALTNATFPNCEKLSADSFGALVSLVFNRGADCSDTPQRREMHQILGYMTAKDFGAVPDAILAMRRLWPNIEGLQSRRAAEAAMFRGGLPVAATTIPTGTVLIPGCRGPLVVALQQSLKAAGCYVGYAVDGVYGPGTRDAVAKFQGERGLFADGIAGAKTWSALGFMEGK